MLEVGLRGELEEGLGGDAGGWGVFLDVGVRFRWELLCLSGGRHLGHDAFDASLALGKSAHFLAKLFPIGCGFLPERIHRGLMSTTVGSGFSANRINARVDAIHAEDHDACERDTGSDDGPVGTPHDALSCSSFPLRLQCTTKRGGPNRNSAQQEFGPTSGRAPSGEGSSQLVM